MRILLNTAVVVALVAPTSAFVPAPSFNTLSKSSTTPLYNILDEANQDLDKALGRRMEYKPGAADSEFAYRFGHLAGKKVKTVGEAFSDFTNTLGSPINALYKNMMTDIVGTLHLIVVNARFQRDGIFSLGLITSLDLLLRNYPETEIKADIISSLFKSVGLDEEEVKAEAKVIEDWAMGKSKEEIAAALKGEGESPVAEVAKVAKKDEFWLYSRYFGIGLIKMMECTGVEMDSETCYPIMEDWMGSCMEKPHFTACNDSDTYFKVKGKLDMMETLMKEVEIREKKRLAQRLEEKAEAALRKAEKEAKLQEEIQSDTEKVENADASAI